MITKSEVLAYLKKYKLDTTDDLARKAGVHRWSLRRFVYHDGDITLNTANKLKLAMIED